MSRIGLEPLVPCATNSEISDVDIRAARTIAGSAWLKNYIKRVEAYSPNRDHCKMAVTIEYMINEGSITARQAMIMGYKWNAVVTGGDAFNIRVAWLQKQTKD